MIGVAGLHGVLCAALIMDGFGCVLSIGVQWLYTTIFIAVAIFGGNIVVEEGEIKMNAEKIHPNVDRSLRLRRGVQLRVTWLNNKGTRIDFNSVTSELILSRAETFDLINLLIDNLTEHARIHDE